MATDCESEKSFLNEWLDKCQDNSPAFYDNVATDQTGDTFQRMLSYLAFSDNEDDSDNPNESSESLTGNKDASAEGDRSPQTEMLKKSCLYTPGVNISPDITDEEFPNVLTPEGTRRRAQLEETSAHLRDQEPAFEIAWPKSGDPIQFFTHEQLLHALAQLTKELKKKGLETQVLDVLDEFMVPTPDVVPESYSATFQGEIVEIENGDEIVAVEIHDENELDHDGKPKITVVHRHRQSLALPFGAVEIVGEADKWIEGEHEVTEITYADKEDLDHRGEPIVKKMRMHKKHRKSSGANDTAAGKDSQHFLFSKSDEGPAVLEEISKDTKRDHILLGEGVNKADSKDIDDNVPKVVVKLRKRPESPDQIEVDVKNTGEKKDGLPLYQVTYRKSGSEETKAEGIHTEVLLPPVPLSPERLLSAGDELVEVEILDYEKLDKNGDPTLKTELQALKEIPMPPKDSVVKTDMWHEGDEEVTRIEYMDQADLGKDGKAKVKKISIRTKKDLPQNVQLSKELNEVIEVEVEDPNDLDEDGLPRVTTQLRRRTSVMKEGLANEVEGTRRHFYEGDVEVTEMEYADHDDKDENGDPKVKVVRYKRKLSSPVQKLHTEPVVTLKVPELYVEVEIQDETDLDENGQPKIHVVVRHKLSLEPPEGAVVGEDGLQWEEGDDIVTETMFADKKDLDEHGQPKLKKMRVRTHKHEEKILYGRPKPKPVASLESHEELLRDVPLTQADLDRLYELRRSIAIQCDLDFVPGSLDFGDILRHSFRIYSHGHSVDHGHPEPKPTHQIDPDTGVLTHVSLLSVASKKILKID